MRKVGQEWGRDPHCRVLRDKFTGGHLAWGFSVCRALKWVPSFFKAFSFHCTEFLWKFASPVWVLLIHFSLISSGQMRWEMSPTQSSGPHLQLPVMAFAEWLWTTRMVISSQEIFECSRSYHQVEKARAGHGWSLKAKGYKSIEDSASCSERARRTQGISRDCIDTSAQYLTQNGDSLFSRRPSGHLCSYTTLVSSGTCRVFSGLIVNKKVKKNQQNNKTKNSPRENPFSPLEQPRVVNIPGEQDCNSC